MKTRRTPLDNQDGQRYWTVVLKREVEGLTTEHKHLFRFPNYSKALALRRMAEELAPLMGAQAREQLPDLAEGADPAERIEHIRAQMEINAEQMADFYANSELQLPLFGALLGHCWHHRGLEFETPTPKSKKQDVLAEFGEAIVDEMQDRYGLHAIQGLAATCLTEITRRLSITELAAQRADFFVVGQTPKSPLQMATDAAVEAAASATNPTTPST